MMRPPEFYEMLAHLKAQKAYHFAKCSEALPKTQLEYHWEQYNSYLKQLIKLVNGETFGKN